MLAQDHCLLSICHITQKKSMKILRASMDTIRKTAGEMIEGIESGVRQRMFVREEPFQAVDLFGAPALFSDRRVELSLLPELVLADIMNLFIQGLDSVLGITERFPGVSEFLIDFLQCISEIFTGIISVFLNIADGFCHFFQIGDFNFLCVGGVPLRFDIILKVNDQAQVRADK